MALFSGTRKTAIDRVLTSGWRTLEERDQVLAQARAEGIRGADAVPLIWHADAAARQLGAELFLARADVAALNEFVARMAEQPSNNRALGLRLVARVPAETMRRVLGELLGERSTPARRRLGWELGLWAGGELRVPFLERAVREAPVAFRGPALQRLLQERPAAQLVELLLSSARDPDAKLAATALEALARLADPRVRDVMIERLQTGDPASRSVARAWLAEAATRDPLAIRKRLLDLLASGEDETRTACVEILLLTGPAEDVLKEVLLFCRDVMGWLRTRILETLRGFGEPILRPAVSMLSHPDPDLRTAALVLAENLADPQLVEPVARLLKDPDWWLRITACDTLGRLKDERAVPYLVESLGDPDARWAAIDALAQIAAPAALKPLSGALQDPRPEVRIEVIRAFSRFTDHRLLELLEQVKERDTSSEVRTRAAEVLRDMQERLDVTVDEAERGTAVAASAWLSRPLDKLLAQIREEGASDLHFTVDEPPLVRRSGKLQRMGNVPPLPAHVTRDAIFSILTENQRATLEKRGELDFCHAVPQVGRYRVNAFHQRRGWCAAFRVIPNVPPTFGELRLPSRLRELLFHHQGIVLISGPAGSGKSSTLSAIVNLINESKPDHVITLEDPIELVHPVKAALVNQREVGLHSQSFARALRAALREDPDVIVVGEMRDTDTMRLALTAAETGHLVIATLHTTGAVGTIDRLVKSFPPEEQQQVRMALSESLKYVVSQSLLPRRDGKGRVAVFEVLRCTLPVASLIRDNKTHQIANMMQIGRGSGMQTVDMALLDLVEAGLISPEAAWRRAEKPELFEALCDVALLRERGVGA